MYQPLFREFCHQPRKYVSSSIAIRKKIEMKGRLIGSNQPRAAWMKMQEA
jgi:hypothetical protein